MPIISELTDATDVTAANDLKQPLSSSVRIVGDHPTAKFALSHVLLANDIIVTDFSEQTPEQIRVRYSEDSKLQDFLREVKKTRPVNNKTEKDRIEHAMKAVVKACGGSMSWDKSCDDKACGDMQKTLRENGLPFVMVGQAIGHRVGCRYRSILFKCIADDSVLHPAEWGGPIHAQLRRSYFSTAHGGVKPHSFNVVVLEGKEHIIDLERSPDNILVQSVPDYEKGLQPMPESKAVVVKSPVLGLRATLNSAPAPLKPQTFAEILKLYGLEPELFDSKLSDDTSKAEAFRQTKIPVTMDFKIQVCLQIAQALSHLHSLSISHGQLTSANIQVNKHSGKVKLIGLDLSRYAIDPSSKVAVVDEAAREQAEQNARAGAAYWAPERFVDWRTMNKSTDVYAFGALLYAVLMDQEPFAGQSFEAIRTTVTQGNQSKLAFETFHSSGKRQPQLDRGEATELLPLELVQLISACMVSDPSMRPSINTCEERLQSCIDLMAVSTAFQWNLHAAALPGATQPPSSQDIKVEDDPVKIHDAVRQNALSKLGDIDRKVIVGEGEEPTQLFIIHRPTDNVALVTRGLSDPADGLPTGFGLELLAEAKESELSTKAALAASYLFQMMHEVTQKCRQVGLTLRQLIDSHGLVSMELTTEVDAPPLFKDPRNGRVGVLLGVPANDVPDSFLTPDKLKVRLVTVCLLTYEELFLIRSLGNAGRKAIAERFAHDGTHHVSSIVRVRAVKLFDLVEMKQVPLSPSEGVSWDEDKVHQKLSQLGVPAQAVADANAKKRVTLPVLDEKSAEPELEVNALFAQFAKPTPVSNAMCRFDMRLRQIASPLNRFSQELAKHVGLAKHVMNALATQTQLAGWKHVQDYARNPEAYVARTKLIKSADDSKLIAADDANVAQPRPIDVLQGTGERLLKRLLKRLEWVLALQTRAGEAFDPDFFLQVLGIDTQWIDETKNFINDAEKKVTAILADNVQKFSAFRALQKKGVQWPHSQGVRNAINSTGFVFKPMMVKRDRCVCEQCNVEIAGWRPWHNPWQMHDLSKHMADFPQRIFRVGAAFPQSGLYLFAIKPANAAAADAVINIGGPAITQSRSPN